MKQLKEFLIKWMLQRIYILLPACYLLACLMGLNFTLRTLFIFIVTGLLVFSVYSSWRIYKRQEVELDVIRQDRDAEGFKDMIKGMPYWERMHWIPIFGFLFLTWYSMVEGLGLLFVGGTNWFIYIFSTIVTLVLLWLVMMISRRKAIIGFVIFYICFDALSAFSFNFVHFYDNISSTQRMDRDMKAIDMYMNIQRGTISDVKSKVKKENINFAQKKKDLGNTISQKNKTSQKARELKDWNKAKKAVNDSIKAEKELEKLQEKNPLTADSIVKEIEKVQHAVEHYSTLYKEKKDKFTPDSLKETKRLLSDLHSQIRTLSNEDFVKSLNGGTLNMENDTIVGAIRRLEAFEEDRFASINKLLEALHELINFGKDDGTDKIGNTTLQTIVPNESEADSLSQHAATTDIADTIKPQCTMFEKQDATFENRLLYLSIALSILIDLLPLALGVFVAYCRKKKI